MPQYRALIAQGNLSRSCVIVATGQSFHGNEAQERPSLINGARADNQAYVLLYAGRITEGACMQRAYTRPFVPFPLTNEQPLS